MMILLLLFADGPECGRQGFCSDNGMKQFMRSACAVPLHDGKKDSTVNVHCQTIGFLGKREKSWQCVPRL